MAKLSNLAASLAGALVVSLAAGALPFACTTIEPTTTTYFESNIAPILSTSCVRSATGSGCHVADTHGNAFGNLDLSSYTGVSDRRDLLATYGPYGQPSLLVKNIPPFSVSIQTFSGEVVKVTTDIKHVGGPLLDPTGGAFQALKQWMNNGATEQNTGIPANTLLHYPCVSNDPDMSVAPFNTSSYMASAINHEAADYKNFKANVAPFIQSTCASGNCHGTVSNELYFLCGSDQAQLDWNYFVAGQYITNPPASSEIIRRPLAPQAGGSFHEGGTIFQSPTDPNYVAFVNWAKEHGPTKFNATKNLTFFASRVQPMLVKKGCMMLQCHSAAMAHDYRLRGGSGGSFSYDATLKNYQLTLEQMNFESPTVDASRIIRKNVLRPAVATTPITTPLEFVDSGAGDDSGDEDAGGPIADAGSDVSTGSADAGADAKADAKTGAKDGAADAKSSGKDATAAAETGTSGGSGGSDASGASGGTRGGQLLGILHRGGPLLEDFGTAGPTGAACDAAAYAYDSTSLDLDTVPAYCMIREWFNRERMTRQMAGVLAPFSGIAYVKRAVPSGSDRAQDWDIFAGPAELHLAKATLDVSGNVALGADSTFDLTTCGLASGADVQRPAVSWDGTKIAFAARSTTNDPLAIYEIASTGGKCTKHALNSVAVPSASSGCATISGALVHNFDPAYAPDGRLVFASTRGNLALAQANVDYCGPQRSPADPSKLNSNLYVFDPTNAGNSAGGLTQLTFLLNMERHPSFMDDGRLIFTTEKRAPGFYQLALRRQNLDTGDYHPLYAQRGSIGYDQADEVVHLTDKNFVAIFSQQGSLHQGGLLGVFNRSVGIDFTSTNPKDYPIDPSVLDAGSLSSIEPAFFNHSLSIPDSNASGTPGTSGNVYTSPAPLPGGKVLVSMSSAQADPGTFNGQYDLVVLDPETGTSNVLVPGGGSQIIEAVGIYARGVRGPAYTNLPAAFVSALDEPNGHTVLTPNTQTVDLTVLDFPVLASLLFQNTPTGRQVDPGLDSVDFYEDMPPTSDVTSLTSSSADIAKDAYGSVYVRRRLLGSNTLLGDGSTHVILPGGVPIVLHLPDTALSKMGSFPRWQREEIEFSPGETLNQSFPRTFFNNVCGQCHSSISGQQVDVAVQPDILTQASVVAGRGAPSASLGLTPGSRTTTFVGPPASP